MKAKLIGSSESATMKFPLIATDVKGSGLTVLFTDEDTATVLIAHGTSDKIGLQVGSFFDGWVSCFETKTWNIIDDVTINFKF